MASTAKIIDFNGTTEVLKFDLNDTTQTFIDGNVKIEAPALRNALLSNFATAGAVLSASQWDLRNITVPIRLKRTTYDLIVASVSSLLQALDPVSFPPTSGFWRAFKWQPQGATAAKYYTLLRGPAPMLFDGRELAVYEVVTRTEIDQFIVPMLAQPFAYGQSVVI